MIPGIDGLHSWTPPGASDPAVILNERGALPRFKVTEISGLDSLATAEDNRDPRVGGAGSIARPSERREKSVTYTGWIEAETRRQLHEAKAQLKAAFADINWEGRMDCAWSEDAGDMEDAPPVFYEARSVICEIPDRQEVRGWKRRFVVALINGDGRYFDEASEVHTVTLTSTNTTYNFT